MGRRMKRYVVRAVKTVIVNRDGFFSRDLIQPVSELIGRKTTSHEISKILSYFTENGNLSRAREFAGNPYIYFDPHNLSHIKNYE